MPNLGQYDHQLIASVIPSERQTDASTDHQHGAAKSAITDDSSSISAQRSTYPPPLSSGVPASMNVAATVAISDHRVSNLSTSTSSSVGFVPAVDDDFDDFKTAPITYTSPAGSVAPNTLYGQSTIAALLSLS